MIDIGRSVDLAKWQVLWAPESSQYIMFVNNLSLGQAQLPGRVPRRLGPPALALTMKLKFSEVKIVYVHVLTFRRFRC